MRTTQESKTGDSLLNYTVIQMEKLEDIDAVFLPANPHNSTGARHIHISTHDKENTFGVMPFARCHR